jgi:nucleotide-binding universal stress UspA family protein
MAATPHVHAHAAHFPAALKSVLVVASALHDARATARVVARLQARESLRVHILAVCTPPSGHARFFLRGLDVRAMQQDEGEEALQPLRAALEAEGVSFRTHVEIGPWLETVARFAREISCSRVVLGVNPSHPWRGLLLRHDCWRVATALRVAGHECPVVRGEERVQVPVPSLPREASRPH